MYRQKSVIFTIYIEKYTFLGQNTKEKEGFFYIYKKTPIISVSIIYIYSQNTIVWARYKRKERVLYRKNTPYIRKTPIIMPIYKKNTI